MKKLLWIGSLTLSLLSNISDINACGPSLYTDESRLALFRNGLNGYNGFEAFYYSEWFLNGNISDVQRLDEARNCQEWSRYINNKKVKIADIDLMQYKISALEFINASEQNDYSPWKENSFMKWLLKKKNKNALTYFIWAKKAELTQFGPKDPWTENGSNIYQKDMETIASTTFNISNTMEDPFLKERYLFQALKMGYYSGYTISDSMGLQLTNQFLNNTQNHNSVVNAWSYHFTGLMQKINSPKYIQYLLTAFDRSEGKKVAVYRALSNIEKEEIERVTKGTDLEEVGLVFNILRNKGRTLSGINKVYSLNPKSKYLSFLISREINKLENWIWSPEILGFNNIQSDFTDFRWEDRYDKYGNVINHKQPKDFQYFDEIVSFLQETLQAKKIDPNFNALALTHLLQMRGDFKSAKTTLNKIKVDHNTKYYQQYLIESIINSSQLEDISSDEVKTKLAVALQQLKAKNILADPNSDFYNDEEMDDYGELLAYLSNVYKNKGDQVTAGLLKQNAHITLNEYGLWGYYDNDTTKQYDNTYQSIAYFDKYAAASDMERLITFKHKEKKTAFEQLLVPIKWASDDMYKDVMGTIFMRSEQYDQALAVFESMNPKFWDQEYFFKDYLPYIKIYDLSSYAPWETYSGNTFRESVSKVLILKDLVSLQKQISATTSNEDKANLLYDLAKAKLNMTYNGNFWMLISYGKSIQESRTGNNGLFYYSFYPNNEKYGNNYYDGDHAKKELLKALKLTKNPDLIAKINLTQILISNLCNDGKTNIKVDKMIANSKLFKIAAIHCPDMNYTIR